MKLPPLPEMDVYHDDHAFGSGPESFSEKAMLAFGESCARMAREEAAKLCEAEEALYRQAVETAKTELGATQFHAMAEGAWNCAAAIRKG